MCECMCTIMQLCVLFVLRSGEFLLGFPHPRPLHTPSSPSPPHPLTEKNYLRQNRSTRPSKSLTFAPFLRDLTRTTLFFSSFFFLSFFISFFLSLLLSFFLLFSFRCMWLHTRFLSFFLSFFLSSFLLFIHSFFSFFLSFV